VTLTLPFLNYEEHVCCIMWLQHWTFKHAFGTMTDILGLDLAPTELKRQSSLAGGQSGENKVEEPSVACNSPVRMEPNGKGPVPSELAPGAAGGGPVPSELGDALDKLLSLSCACGDEAEKMHKVTPMSQEVRLREFAESEDAAGEREYNLHTQAYREAWQAELESKVPDPDKASPEEVQQVIFGHMAKWATDNHGTLCCDKRHPNLLVAIAV